MLSLLYIVVIALPLTLAAGAFLIIAVRGAERRVGDRRTGTTDEERTAAEERRERERRGLRNRSTVLATPPDEDTSFVRLRQLGLRAALKDALDPETPVPGRRMADPRLLRSPEVQIRETSDLAAASSPDPLPAGVATKDCPDCAETVLAAARICKHCRFRFDGEQDVVAFASLLRPRRAASGE